MNTLREALQEYLALRRGLGFKMHDAGLVLPRFVAFMEQHQALHITTRLALEWVQQAKTVQPAERARRLCFARGFARYRSATDPLTEVPSPELLPYRSTRARPYLYTEQEVLGLLEAALQLPTAWPSTPLRPWVFHCLLGLLSVTGLRLSEALDLKLDPGCQVRSIPPRAPQSIHTHRAGPLPSAAQTVSRRAPLGLRVRIQSWHAARHRSRSSSFLRAVAANGPAGARRAQRPPAARLPAPLCGSSAHPLVRVGRGPGATTAGAVDLSRARIRGRHLLVSQQLAGADGTGDGAAGAALGRVIMTGQPTFPTLLERFFTQRLMQQRQASAHTIASYRDTFRLLLQFAQKRLRRAPSTLALEDIDAPLVVDFLDELEKVRDVTARTRNLRLTAIHSFFHYVAFEAPAHAAQIQRVLAIPAKRFARALVPFLSRQEVDALLAAPDQRTWSGRRDHALILLAVQTGLRLSELTGLQQQDLHLGTGAHVRVIGKGRKERCTPLSKNTRAVLAAWVKEPLKLPDQPLFPNASGGRLSAHGVHYLLAKHVAAATTACPSLKHKRVSPHVLRHTTAMDLLQQGVEQSVIALWLGHESIETTQIYLDADLELKQQVLDLVTPLNGKPGRYRPDDKLLAFLRSL
jgi:site-specific recombinase XerD